MMYGLGGGFQGFSIEDMSILYSPSFRNPDSEMRKNQEFMDFNHYQYAQPNHQSSSLIRYRSAPSSFFDSLVNGGDSGIGGEDFRYMQSSSSEIDAIFGKLVSPSNVLGDSNAHVLQDFEERQSVKQEVVDSEMVYQDLPGHDLGNDNAASVENSLQSTFGVMNSMTMENSMQATKMSPPANGSNLVRQNSSPPGLYSNLGVDNGFAVMKDVGTFGVPSGTNVKFSSTPSVLPQIAESGDENIGSSSPENSIGKRQYTTSFMNGAWDDNSSNSFKRARDNDGNAFSSLNMLDERNGNSGNGATGLTHHLSLPKTAAEMATIEKYLQFQGTVPCKIRAKRGCATHPRSIAERVRRTRISERMRKLQDLFPNMDKQTSTADMLDLAVEYIKDLQKEVKTLTDCKAKCMCLSKRQN